MPRRLSVARWRSSASSPRASATCTGSSCSGGSGRNPLAASSSSSRLLPERTSCISGLGANATSVPLFRRFQRPHRVEIDLQVLDHLAALLVQRIGVAVDLDLDRPGVAQLGEDDALPGLELHRLALLAHLGAAATAVDHGLHPAFLV